MSRCDLTDLEWRVIESLLPNKPRGVPRAENYLAALELVAIRIWLRGNESTT